MSKISLLAMNMFIIHQNYFETCKISVEKFNKLICRIAIHIYNTMQNESLTIPYYNGDEGGGGWVGCVIYELVDSC